MELIMLILFIKGLIVGLAIAAPVGPIGVLCIQRSLHDGFKIGFMTGLGAALADGSYAFIIGFGLTALSSILLNYQFWIQLLGGLFLSYLGIKLCLTRQSEKSQNKAEYSSWRAISTTFLLTLTNPATILAFLAIFTGLGLEQTSKNYLHAGIFVVSITLGSMLWWLLLSGSIAFILHHRLSPNLMKKINKLSGMIIFAFGVFSLMVCLTAK